MIVSLRNKLITAGLFLLLILMSGSGGYYALAYHHYQRPAWSFADCFYMSVITLTTVGFGEIVDLASVPGARMFTVILLVGGLGVATYFVSTLTAFLVEGDLKNFFWRGRMKKEIGKLSGHFILCGGGRVGRNVLEEMIVAKRQFVLIETTEAKVAELQEHLGFFPAVIGDAVHNEFLEAAGVARAAGVVSCLGDDRDNLCVVVTCQQLNPGLKIISRCSDLEFARKLEVFGAQVVIPNFIGGLRLASQLIRPRVVQYLDIMLRDKEYSVRIEDLNVSDDSELAGVLLQSLDWSVFGNLLLLAVVEPGTVHPYYNPPTSYQIKGGDTLIFQAELGAMAKLRQRYLGAE